MTAKQLTETQIGVLKMLCSGQTDREIAATLGISPALVRHHTQAIRDSTGERSISALCRQLAADERAARSARR